MNIYQFTAYFEEEVLKKRPYLSKDMCIMIIEQPYQVMVQTNGRIRFWGLVPELGNRYLRVITLEDRMTNLNAFLDRGFKP